MEFQRKFFGNSNKYIYLCTKINNHTTKVMENIEISNTLEGKREKMTPVSQTMGFPDGLVDKNGDAIAEDDVIYDGRDYYRIYWNSYLNEVEAVGDPGYLQDTTPDNLSRFIRIGPYSENQELMISD